MTITPEQLTEYLQESGQTVPAFVVDAIVADLATYSGALDAAGYTASQRLMVELYSGAIVALRAGGRRIASQSSPSGSRSFDNSDVGIQWLLSALRKLDTAGVLIDYAGGKAGATWFEIGRA